MLRRRRGGAAIARLKYSDRPLILGQEDAGQEVFPNVSELQGRVDGVSMRPRRLDAVDVAA